MMWGRSASGSPQPIRQAPPRTQDFTVTVANTNDAPVASVAIADQSTDEDAGFSFTVPPASFTDVDVGDSLTYSATLADGSALPSWLSFDPATQTFSGTPLNEDVGALNDPRHRNRYGRGSALPRISPSRSATPMMRRSLQSRLRTSRPTRMRASASPCRPPALPMWTWATA